MDVLSQMSGVIVTDTTRCFHICTSQYLFYVLIINQKTNEPKKEINKESVK